jgi:hypothetical protein
VLAQAYFNGTVSSLSRLVSVRARPWRWRQGLSCLGRQKLGGRALARDEVAAVTLAAGVNLVTVTVVSRVGLQRVRRALRLPRLLRAHAELGARGGDLTHRTTTSRSTATRPPRTAWRCSRSHSIGCGMHWAHG